MAFSFFRPFATGNGATVLSPGTYATQSWLSTGFQPGIADPASVNTVWRQGSFVFAGITQWMANTLNVDIHDDGNLNNFITNFGNAIVAGSNGGVTSFDTRTGAVVLNSTDVITALGYTPVRSLNGRTGQVIINSSDINSALGYQPLKKSGDTMAGLLSGPDPTTASHYATKHYVDTAVAAGHSGSGNINGSISELNFPLGNGGIIKVGLYVYPLSTQTSPPTFTYLINFITPFRTQCAGVFLSQMWQPSNTPGQDGFHLGSQPPAPIAGNMSIGFDSFITNKNSPNFNDSPHVAPSTISLPEVLISNLGFYMDQRDWPPLGEVPPYPVSMVWTAIGF